MASGMPSGCFLYAFGLLRREIRRRLWHIYQCKDGYISIYMADRYRRYVEFTVVNCEKEIYI